MLRVGDIVVDRVLTEGKEDVGVVVEPPKEWDVGTLGTLVTVRWFVRWYGKDNPEFGRLVPMPITSLRKIGEVEL